MKYQINKSYKYKAKKKKFDFIINSKLNCYLIWLSKKQKLSRGELVRKILIKTIETDRSWKIFLKLAQDFDRNDKK